MLFNGRGGQVSVGLPAHFPSGPEKKSDALRGMPHYAFSPCTYKAHFFFFGLPVKDTFFS